MKKPLVLVLPSWLPSRVDEFNGDFIQRHIECISIFADQHILYVVKDKSLLTRVDITNLQIPGCTGEVIYYRSIETGIKLLDRFISHLASKRIKRKAIRAFIARRGRPDLVHVHVAFKAGLEALWIKKSFSIPYIVSEHSSSYLDVAKKNIYQFPPRIQAQTRDILREANAVTAVSEYLCKSLIEFMPGISVVKVPNVVNTNIFFPGGAGKREPFLIHASTMNDPKNLEEMLGAMLFLKDSKPGIELHLYGPPPGWLAGWLPDNGLQGQVKIKGEVTQAVLADAMRYATALLHYSHYETFGCVVIEAGATKIPVIVSKIPALEELVSNGIAGRIVTLHQPRILADVIADVVENTPGAETNDISAYTYPVVGRKFLDVYKSILQD